jgi:uncharacterized protein involved in type VI secretion and phage assembly
MDEAVARYIERHESKCWGKYRGFVVDRNDPERVGRLRLTVPSVFGAAETGWASPCSPYAGADIGFFFLPQPGDMVWVEFEEGDLDHPIWSGGAWAKPGNTPEVPKEAAPYPDTAVIKTRSGNVIVLSDASGGEQITIRAKGGCEIVLDPNSNVVTIQAGEVQIRGTGGVTQELATRAFVEQVYAKHIHDVVGKVTLMPIPDPEAPVPLLASVTAVLKAE